MSDISKGRAKELVNANGYIFDELIAQIAKDCHLEPDWYTFGHNLIRLQNSLMVKLQELLDDSPKSIHQLLYIIDVNEHELRKDMQRGRYASLSELLSERIVERELKKVIFRNVYSGKLKI
ncbi:MAG: hypothetical protein N4A46_04380 [Schleiferiaceae bacterium]|jgi:hypothetical protein|nr:hypothetical protein [Schleiferiaceae bacterium]